MCPASAAARGRIGPGIILQHRAFLKVIELFVNGEARRVPARTSVAQLIEQMNLGGKRVAVERNGEIVPKSRHAEVELAPGDRLEIVVAVGGG